jgi:hypothetical protein
VTSGMTRIVSVVDSESFFAQPHKVRHRDVVNRTGMANVFLGDLVTTPGSRKLSSSGGEFSDENDFAILKKVKSLTGQIDDDR